MMHFPIGTNLQSKPNLVEKNHNYVMETPGEVEKFGQGSTCNMVQNTPHPCASLIVTITS